MYTIVSILIVFITLINSLIALTFLFRKYGKKQYEEDSNKSVSIIVAFKNEKENLPSLINALSNQNFDNKLFEVILVDDNSYDGSFELALDLVKVTKNFKVIKNNYSPSKKNALLSGIENSKNEILIFTDADCSPQKNWLKTIIENFDSKTDLVYGFSPPLPEKSFVNKICIYENLFTSTLMTSFQNVEFPYMVFGRNLGYRKSLFEKVKGFTSIAHSLSGDDDLFFQLALKFGAKVKLITNPESIVFTKCRMTFSEFFRRKARHISASKFYLPEIKLPLALIYGSNFLFNIFVIPSFLLLDIFLITLILFNWLIKILLSKILLKKFRVKFPIYLIPMFDFIYFLIIPLIGIRSRLKSVNWK